ncbi:MAG: NADH-quinone oxidoreductase subunit M [Bdellovibrionales bacterium]|nr:NADH-quinone oxidoreductase subunit M [Bdellovibrionales bacterium]
MSLNLISWMIFLPFLGAISQIFLPGRGKWAALAASILSACCGTALILGMDPAVSDLQAVEILPWVGSYSITYEVGMDGLNALLVLLISWVMPVLIAAEWKQKKGVAGMHALFLILQASLLGAVCAQDLFLVFFFWALSAVPMYFLIGIWGGDDRESASFRTLVVSAIGNAFFFGALILIYYSFEPHTFSLKELAGGKFAGKTFHFLDWDLPVPLLAFSLMSLGLALRTPIWPLHGWFTVFAQQSPLSVFVAVSSVMTAVASYLFVKLSFSLFPETISATSQGIVAVGLLNLIAGGLGALSQKNLRTLLSFVCIGEVGIALVGYGSLNSVGIVGAVFQLLSLGLGIAGFGLFINVLNERKGSTDFLKEGTGTTVTGTLGGIAVQAPGVAVVAAIMTGTLLGFPGVSGFIGHSLLVMGSYSVHPIAVVVTVGAFFMATFYFFTMYRHVFLGKAQDSSVMEDLNFREKLYLLPLVFLVIWFGIYPKPLIDLIRPTVLTLLSTIK